MLNGGSKFFSGQFNSPPSKKQGDQRKVGDHKRSRIAYTFSDFIDTITKTVI